MKVSKILFQSSREFDMVIFGASGFTGKHVVEYICSKPDLPNYKLAFAGRDTERIKSVTKHISRARNIPVIRADVSDVNSMKHLTARTNILLNCVGPYQLLGDSVVKSCIDTSTHHLDVSGEPFYLESVQLKYHDDAIKNNTLVIGACGFDSVPADLGVDFVINKFGSKNIESISTYLQTKSSKGRIRGNHPTWVSLVTGYSNYGQLRRLRKVIFDPKFYEKLFPINDKLLIPKDVETAKQCINTALKVSRRQAFHYMYDTFNLPFPGSDRSVIKRSQILNLLSNYPNYNLVPVETYFGFPNVVNLLGVAFGAISIQLLKSKEVGKNLLIDHANIFSLGLFDRNVNPSREQLDSYSFELLIVANINDRDGPREKKLLIAGPDPGYKTAAICLIESALTIISEKHLIPVTGGAITPAFAFGKTSLVDRLNENGIKFQFVD